MPNLKTGKRRAKINNINSQIESENGADDEEQTISIELVREKLKANQFKDIDEFCEEMQKLFSAWQLANGKNHKYFKTFQLIVERFTKQMNRAK